jgi:hypothetical protein
VSRESWGEARREAPAPHGGSWRAHRVVIRGWSSWAPWFPGSFL